MYILTGKSKAKDEYVCFNNITHALFNCITNI